MAELPLAKDPLLALKEGSLEGVRKGVRKDVRKGVRKDVRKGARERYDGYTKRPTRVIYIYIFIYKSKNPQITKFTKYESWKLYK